MKILQVCSAPISFLGGMERVVLKLSKELSKDHEELVHGSQVSLYHFEDPEHPELVSLVEAIEKV